MRVYRTRDGGKHWEALTNGLPQKNAHETVLRDALCVDALNPAGVYFGTRSGKVYASSDGGATWNLVIDGLPAVQCVKAYYIGNPAKARIPHARGARTAKKPAAAPRAKQAPAKAKSAGKKVAKSAAKPPAKKSVKKATKKATKKAASKLSRRKPAARSR